MEKMNKTCASCGGSGQISYFQGVSRFLLTSEECPECSGTGYLVENGSVKKDEDRSLYPGRDKKKKGTKR